MFFYSLDDNLGGMEMYRRNGYVKDIETDEVFIKPLCYVAAIFIIMAFFLLLGWPILTDDQKSIAAFNEYAEAFNALGEHDREVAAPFLKYELPEDSTTFTLREKDEISYWGHVARVWYILLGILYVTYSIGVFIEYLKSKTWRYHMADLPLSSWIGRLLLVALIPFYPVLVVSLIIMMIKVIRLKFAEKKALREEIQREIDKEQPSPILIGRANEKAEATYVKYVVGGSRQARESHLKELEEQKTDVENRLANYGRSLREAQKRKSEILAELKKYELVEQESVTRERAINEWNAIRHMRGVSRVYARKRRKKVKGLVIQVDVRVPYKNKLYDFGDYEIRIDGREYSCTRVRSGVRMDASSTAPDYNEPSGFCFGSRRRTIADYVCNGRYLEAISLMIDSLHSVNDAEVEAKIPYCFREVEVEERVRRKLLKEKGGN